MAAELFCGILLILPLCEGVEDDIEGVVIGGCGNVRELLLLILVPLFGSAVLPLILSSPFGQALELPLSIQASRRFFLSNLLKTFE